jgi:hypothetical protein
LFELSPHAVPVDAGAYVTTPVAGLHVPTMHGFDVSIGTGGCCTHAPLALQAMTPVHKFVELPQIVPTGAIGFEHAPDAGSHAPATWQASSGAHATGAPAHAPFKHASPAVHAFPSLHDVPFPTGGLLHAPVAGSQVPAP